MIKTVLAIFLVSCLPGRAILAQDWTQWRGPNRDGVISGFVAPKSWPEQLKSKWKVTVGIGHSSPLVAGRRVYLHSRQGENEVVSAFNLETGKLVWHNSYPAAYTVNPAAFAHGKGPKSTPVISQDRLYTLGITGILSCYDAATGRLVWRKDFAEKFKVRSPLYGTAMSPLVDRSLVIVHTGGNNQGGLVAMDASTGAEKWVWTGDGPGYASPIAVDLGGVRQIVTQSQQNIIGLSADKGELLWQIPFKTDYVQNIVTPILYKDLLIFSGLNNGVFAVRIIKRGAGLATEQVWQNKEVSMYMNSPVLSGNMLFGLSHRNKGQFFCLDAATGKTLWTGDPRQGENAAMLLAGDVIFSLTNDAELILTSAADKGANPIRKYKVADSPTWAHPAIAGKSILIKDENTLSLWSIE